MRKRAGVIVPLFSVWSKESIGIGEIPDLKLLIDWCRETGNKILELLPLNDTGFNFRPYDSQSSFALDPIYLSLKFLRGTKTKILEEKLDSLAKKFPLSKKRVNYGIKEEKLKKLWSFFLKEANPSNKRFRNFTERNRYWLKDYCLFRILKEQHDEKPWEDWKGPFKDYNRKALRGFEDKYRKEIQFQQWLQWQLFEQFKEAKRYAEKYKIFLKGDLPLLVSRDSADVWSKRRYFKLNLATGAPPDFFASKGQRWGMPPYNWSKISKDDFIYIIERLRYAENFYDLFRIDHIVGIFRIWTILKSEPFKNQGLSGTFDPRNCDLWEKRGRTILKKIVKNTKMLPCAEDLGTVPLCCPKVLKEIGIPSLRLQRWNKNWRTYEFRKPQAYNPLSVLTLSTHDTSNFPAWWEEEAGTVDKGLFKRICSEKNLNFRRIRKKLFQQKNFSSSRLRWKSSIGSEQVLLRVLGKPEGEVRDLVGLYRKSYREKERFWKMLFGKGSPSKEANKKLIKKNLEMINRSASIFTSLLVLEWLFLSDVLSSNPSQYRFNTPGTIFGYNWSLRMPISLEDLLEHPIKEQIRRIIRRTGRL